MFWGLIMEPQRRYSQKVKKSFHVSMAALDITTCTDNEPTQVICSFDNRNYLLCTLQKDKAIQVPLDLNFEVDDTVCFATNGKANIHLTGYLTDEFGDLDDTGDLNDTVDSDDTSDSVDAEETEEKVTTRKRQSVENNTSHYSFLTLTKSKLESFAESCNLPSLKKKPKTLELLAAVDSQKEDTDSDDSDYDLSNALNEEGSDDDDDEMDITQAEEEEGGEEEEDEKEEDDEAEEEESDNEDEESDDDGEDASSLSDNEEVEKPKIAKVNGVPKKEEQKQKQSKKEVLETLVSQKEKKPKTPKSEKAQQQQQQKSEKTPKGNASKLSKDESKTPGQTAKSPPQSPAQKRTIEGGVVVEDLKLGNGQIAKTGRVVQVYYEGRFKNNKKMFDSTTKGPGFKFRLGRQEVIKGWDVGVIGMKVGGKRRITCPPNMAYGQKGSPPAIPPNSTLVFEVELKNVN